MGRSKTLRAGVAVVGAATVFWSTAGMAWASSTDGGGTTADKLTHGEIGLNLLWIVIGAVLVIFMQAGFALVETGFCRAKHAAHVVSTNFAVFGLGFVAYFCVGYAFMFGGFSFPNLFGYDKAIGGPLIGSANHVLLWKGGFFLSGHAYDVSVLAFFLYMVAFMDTTATIPTGAMAERWKWSSFVQWGLFCGAVYYPLFGAWTWGGGWLAKLGISVHLGHGYTDFAGSGVVHMMGGVAALAGSLVLGPRIGKYGPDGKPRTLPGHHIPMAMLGTFILLFGWFGFNAASTFAATDHRFAVVAANTAIAAAFGAVFAMVWVQMRTKKPDPGMMANGMLAGLVGITAPCAFIQPWAAAIVGIVAGVVVVESVWFIERRGVDDPVGAISVHGVCGAWGVLAVGIFADGSYGGDWNGTGIKTQNLWGVLYGHGGWGQLGAQAIGVATIAIVMGGIAYAFFKIQNALTKGGIRPTAEVELGGVDIPEMGVLAYPEFYGSSPHNLGDGNGKAPEADPTPAVVSPDAT
ncbi:MAG: ammonium transporter [Actinomycetota bacterium]|nr:ammonium transporter [Actinomycetota bacterium]